MAPEKKKKKRERKKEGKENTMKIYPVFCNVFFETWSCIF